jgi:hypothetical protein
MRRVALFVEDFGHEEFITAWVQRLSRETGVPVDLHPYSVRGGHGRALYRFTGRTICAVIS